MKAQQVLEFIGGGFRGCMGSRVSCERRVHTKAQERRESSLSGSGQAIYLTGMNFKTGILPEVKLDIPVTNIIILLMYSIITSGVCFI